MACDTKRDQFFDILEKNIGILIKVSGVFTRVEQDREDLINDITFELWKSFNSFKGDSKISTWIYRVALNTSMNFRRKKRHDALIVSFFDFKKADGIPWLTENDNSSELEILHDCIDELDRINKAIILLYLDGKSHDEIADVMGVSKTNVGTRIYRIKERLKSLATSKI
ncbi:MAG TPA: sigma-70 family RNA polymerase sigma factor [Bacteroidales bacterium]|nr:sigma-70 family RNA polymerase sigma factor [Bacteroidales bacterium]